MHNLSACPCVRPCEIYFRRSLHANYAAINKRAIQKDEYGRCAVHLSVFWLAVIAWHTSFSSYRPQQRLVPYFYFFTLDIVED